MEVVLASANSGKLRELERALAPLGWTLRLLSEFSAEQAEETGSTFRDNALIKARHAAKLSGLPALADDSGLAVEALGGAPGVYSARYAGPQATDADNNAKLLDALEGQAQRSAAFCCVLAFVRDAEDPQPVLAEGRWQGQILQSARGEGGFGYDPLFLDPALGSSAAELDPATKTAHSHRGRAVTALIQALSAA